MGFTEWRIMALKFNDYLKFDSDFLGLILPNSGMRGTND